MAQPAPRASAVTRVTLPHPTKRDGFASVVYRLKPRATSHHFHLFVPTPELQLKPRPRYP
jgi:hypothetical protein